MRSVRRALMTVALAASVVAVDAQPPASAAESEEWVGWIQQLDSSETTTEHTTFESERKIRYTTIPGDWPRANGVLSVYERSTTDCFSDSWVSNGTWEGQGEAPGEMSVGQNSSGEWVIRVHGGEGAATYDKATSFCNGVSSGYTRGPDPFVLPIDTPFDHQPIPTGETDPNVGWLYGTITLPGGASSYEYMWSLRRLDCDNTVDTDGDGLGDCTEIDLSTDPANPDTDGDGVSDGGEVDAGTDPLDPDEVPTNSRPVAVPDQLIAPSCGAFSLDLLGNDYDPDGDAISLAHLDSQTIVPVGGEPTGSQGFLTYVGPAPTVGTYAITDGELDSAPAEIIVNAAACMASYPHAPAVANPGKLIPISLSGYDPRTQVGVWLASDPEFLGLLDVAPDGTVSATVQIPIDAQVGDHTLWLIGSDSAGEPWVGSGPITIAVDTDGDGVLDPDDNCVDVPNVDQANHDGDDSGDVCDPDDDNDGVNDDEDAFPFDPAESSDNDGDGIGDNADQDDDNDGQSDIDETACGSDPLDAASTSPDADGNGVPDCLDEHECTIVGTEERDRLFGTNGDDVICGLGGNDFIFGLGGNDIIFGGDGKDLIFGGSGHDELNGEQGRDLLLGWFGNDDLNGGPGNDRLFGWFGSDSLNGGTGLDLCSPGWGAATIVDCELVPRRSLAAIRAR